VIVTLLSEIQSKCSAELIASRNHDAIAAAVNVGRTKVVQTLGGIGTVLETLGPDAGAALLDTLETIAITNSAVKWAFVLINRGELDFGSAATRAMIDLLIPGTAGAALKAVAEVADPVTAQQVSDALGG
jgi:hypothetical protein